MKEKHFTINVLAIHWIDDDDDEIDLCAHGHVRVKIGNEVIADLIEEANHWTLSAMALHLLRTLEKNHTIECLVSEHLIPCCGHNIDHLEGESDVSIQNCFRGVNYWVMHEGENIILETENGYQVTITLEEYKKEVFGFVDEVEKFYKDSNPKVLPDDRYQREGYEKFWKEWYRRRGFKGN